MTDLLLLIKLITRWVPPYICKSREEIIPRTIVPLITTMSANIQWLDNSQTSDYNC